MAYKIQAGFGTGELDPALHERTNLDKYKAALKTARNVQVGKTGRLISRPGTKYLYEKTSKTILYAPPFASYLYEFGHNFINIYLYNTTTREISIYILGIVSTFTESDLPYLHFASDRQFLYIFREGIKYKVLLPTLGILADGTNYQHPAAALTVVTFSGSGGYNVDYVATYDDEGEESKISAKISGTLPVTAGTANLMRLTVTPIGGTSFLGMKMKVYRRPSVTGATSDTNAAYGFIGYGVYFDTVAGDHRFLFTDYGQDADYTHQPPDMEATYYADSTTLGTFNAKPKTGVVFQQRLLLSGSINKEAIFSSRPSIPWNFTRDYPLNSASALAFKSGTSGYAQILRMFEGNGLIVFTTVGVFISQPGALTPENLALDKRGSWIIDDRVPPLEVPGALLFVDKVTNSIVAINYDDNSASFQGSEISIFSDHLFQNKRIVSWGFQYGDTPTVWCVMDDGTLNGLTFNKEHQMQAWTHHDTAGLFESIAIVKNPFNYNDDVFFTVLRNGIRTIETLTPRYVTDLKTFVGCDSAVVKSERPMDGDGITGFYTVTPVVYGDYDGELTLYNDYLVFDNTAGNGAVGSIFRMFDEDGSAIDLTVTQYISANSVVVTPSCTFPPDESPIAGLYKTFNVIDGLTHLEGKQVTVFVDGYVEASPLNAIENYDSYFVSGGQITLANGRRGAITTIGLPYAVDIETLDVDTVEQQPTLLESVNASKIYLRVQDTRGLYVGNEFPDLDTNEGMTDPEYQTEALDLVGNAAQKPYSRRVEFFIPGDWKSQGRICIRQVDPLPVEILSIIPDLEVYRR